mgnify:CR=1 FL=1
MLATANRCASAKLTPMVRLCVAVFVVFGLACERPPSERPPTAPTGVGRDGPDDAGVPRPGADEPGDDTPARPSPPSGERFAVIPESHAMYGRFEVPDMPNACDADTQCHVGGCSGETCSAEPDVVTTCELLPARLPDRSHCGCVEGQCRWWHPEGASLVEMGSSSTRPEPRTGEAPQEQLVSCDGKRCKPGQECVSYLGIAGTRGPEFHSCEWRCRPERGNDGCPAGMQCRTIADGPGRVCRE